MKQLVKRILVFIVDPFVRRLGYEQRFFSHNEHKTNSKDDLISAFIGLIKSAGYSPKLIVDIGANHGSWSRVWKKAFPETSFILVEPQHWLKVSFSDILDEKTKFLPIGVAASDGIAKFTINADRDDSSTFTLDENSASALGYKQVEIPVKCLNTIVKEEAAFVPDMVKIDAEGLDIEVLKGATDLFGKTEIFFVEASVNCPMEHTSLLKVVEFMNQAGYKVFDITDINRPFSNRLLWLLELVFIKKNGYFSNLKWDSA